MALKFFDRTKEDASSTGTGTFSLSGTASTGGFRTFQSVHTSGDEVFYAEEHTKEEMQDFLNSLNPTQFNKIRDFFQTMPYLRHEFEYVCDKCGCKENINLAGVEDFFA